MALKLLRLFVGEVNFAAELARLHLHHFIARCIDANSTSPAAAAPVVVEAGDKSTANQALQPQLSDQEPNPCRPAAVKLALSMASACSPERRIPKAIVEATREVARSKDDPCCRVAMDVISNIALRDAAYASQCGLLTLVVEAVVDPYFKALQENLLLTILFLLDGAETRSYVTHLPYILAPLTGSNVPDLMEALQLSTRALTFMLKTWPGIVWANEQGATQALVSGLSHSDSRVTSLVVDAFFEIFRIPHPGTSNPFQRQEVVPIPDELLISPTQLMGDTDKYKSKRQNLIHNYLAILLMSFIEAGIVEALIELGNEIEDSARIKVTVLLAELLYLSNSLLPPAACARIQQTPALVKKAVSFRLDAKLRSRATTTVTNLHKYTDLKASQELLLDTQMSMVSSPAGTVRRIKDHRLDRIDEVKRKLEWEIDIESLLARVRQTQVPTFSPKGKDKWKWEIIAELLDGPLHNPAFLPHLAKLKFFKRLLSFYTPDKHLFCDMAWSYDNLLYVRVGCQLLELLTETEPGKQILKEHKFVKEVAELLVKCKDDSKDTFFTRERMTKTMAREYFALVGVLSRSKFGLEILSEHHIFPALKAICERSQREEIINAILVSLDYERKPESQGIISSILTSAKGMVIRFLATRHLRQLLRSGVVDFDQWGVDLLQMILTPPPSGGDKDPDVKARPLALSVLDEAVDDEKAMLRLITNKFLIPNELQTKNRGARTLQIRFLSLPQGYKFLREVNWISAEMDKWFTTDNLQYVQACEDKLSSVLNRPLNRRVTGVDTQSILHAYNSEDEVFVFHHFFGELAKTGEGCKLLKKTNAVGKFLKTIYSTKTSNQEKRGAVWALGHIASSQNGLEFLEQHDIVLLLVKMAENDPSLSMRGTCFYVLGMMSALAAVRRQLDELGWECPFEAQSRIAIPKNLRKNTLLRLQGFGAPPTMRFQNPLQLPASMSATAASHNTGEHSDAEIRQEILTAICNLSNHVSADGAQKSLRRFKGKYPHLFADVTLLFEIFKLLEQFSFRMKQRRFIHELFEDVEWSDEALLEIDKKFPSL